MQCIKCSKSFDPAELPSERSKLLGLCLNCRWYIRAEKLAELEIRADHVQSTRNLSESLSTIPSLIISAKQAFDRIVSQNQPPTQSQLDEDDDWPMGEIIEDE